MASDYGWRGGGVERPKEWCVSPILLVFSPNYSKSGSPRIELARLFLLHRV